MSGLRVLKTASGGPAGDAEFKRMVDKKVASGLSLHGKAATGGLDFSPERVPSNPLSRYRRKVSANRRRLLKS